MKRYYIFNHLNDSNEKNIKKVYKCPDCSAKYNDTKSLFKHVEDIHSENIPEGCSVKKYCFDRRNPNKEHKCVICKKRDVDWNENKGRYERLCDNPTCREESRKRAQDNYRKKHGKDYDISDPKKQQEMQYSKKNAGSYTFEDGGLLRYLASYEKDFLEFCDKELKLKSTSLEECPIFFKYEYEGVKKHYIPDYYMPEFNLVIEIKDGDENPNTHPKIRAIDKETEKLKDNAVIKDRKHNFIKIVDKNYEDFIKIYKILKDKDLNENGEDNIIIVIPEPKKNINAYKGPDIDIIVDKDEYENFYKTIISKLKGCIYTLVLNKEKIPKEYLNDKSIKESKDNLIILRKSEISNKNGPKDHIKAFKEFKYYFTKKYEKYLDNKYLGVHMNNMSKDYCVLTVYNSQYEDLDNEIENSIINNISGGYYKIEGENKSVYLISVKKNQNLKQGSSTLKDFKKKLDVVYYSWLKINGKPITNYSTIKIDECKIPVPGSLEYSQTVSLIDNM